jgi:hypothetical protein
MSGKVGGRKRSRSKANGPPPGATVAIVQDPSRDASQLLSEALKTSGFWQELEKAHRASGVRKSDFQILIKPDLELFDLRGPAGTDPALVERLIHLLHDRGYVNTAVCGATGSSALWL